MRRRILAAATTAIAATAALLLAPATAAYADAPTAMDRCLAGLWPNESQTITHWAHQATSTFPDGPAPDNRILPGDVVKVTASGWITYDWRRWFVGPNGTGDPAPAGWPYPGMSQISLVATFNNNPGGWVGPTVQITSLQRCVRAPDVPTRLVYGLNDIVLWDNTQWFTIRTDLYYGS
jgi:hypothetical protein